MKIFNVPIPFTEPNSATLEIENLKRELREKDLALQGVRAYNDRLFNDNRDLCRKYREKDVIRISQVRCQVDRAQKLKEENVNLRQENEVYRAVFNALSAGHALSQEWMLELVRQATKIERDAQQSCSLSCVYAVQICNEADRILSKLNEKEAQFFQALLGDHYTPPNERGKDWQSEHEIRQELCREMYGAEDLYGDLSEDQEAEQNLDRGDGLKNQQDQGRGLQIGR